MNQYKQYLNRENNLACIVIGSKSIPLDPANTDYANFRKEILADEAQLQDADGNTMTAEQAKDYIKELP